MNNYSKKKAIISSSIVFCILFVMVGLSYFKGANGLKASVGDSDINKLSANDVCESTDLTNYINVKGSVLENIGNDSVATIAFKSDSSTFTKKINVSSASATYFNYNLPKDTYVLTVTIDGFQTYTKTINEDLKDTLYIKMYNNDYPTLYSSGAIISYQYYKYYNQYYKYYTDGTLYIYQEGYQTDVEFSSALYSVVTNILNKYNTPLNITDSGISGDILQLAAFFSFPCVIGSDYWSVVQDSTAGRASYIDSYNKIDSGICNDNNLDDSACENVKKIKQFFGSLEKGKRAISIILSIPINTDVVIDDSVKTLYDAALIGTVDDDFDLPEQIASIGDSSFYMVKYNTLRIPGTFETAPSFVSSLINNIIIEEGVETLVSSAFANLNMDKHNYASVSLPSTLKTISDSAFRKAYINNINLQEGLESIESTAFNKTQLSSITIPSTVTSIGSDAFANITTLTEVTVNGNKTRFNNNWNDIGFPSNLMPTN